MRRLFTLFYLVVSVFVVWGSAQCDSVKVYFPLNKATLSPALNNDSASMAKFIDGIATAANSGNLNHIAVYGYASPEGPFRNNYKLSDQRCAVVAEYISRQAGIPLNYIYTSSEGAAWEGLRALVIANTGTPSRDTVLQILNHYLPDVCTEKTISDRCINRLKAIDDGHTYNWMLENLFPKLRFALAVYSYTAPADSSATAHPVLGNVESDLEPIAAEEGADTILSVPSPSEQIAPTSLPPLHRLALKTNFLYYAALLPNLEVEWRINNDWSVALEGTLAMWGDYDKGKSYRLATISPEVKRWIHPRAPWHGLYVGIFAGAGLYDFEKNLRRGYRGEGVMGGLSVGYMWPVSRCLSLEAAVGAGYLYTRYKEYEPMDGHHVYLRTKGINYFGPLKAKFSLVWRFWDLNQSGRQNKNQPAVQYEK